MSYIGSWNIDDFITFTVNTHDPITGAAVDADALPAYRIYEDETTAAIATGTMDLLDGTTNTVGFYSERRQLTTALGFEKGKTYTIYISVVVGGVAATTSKTFQVGAMARIISGTGTGELNLASGVVDADMRQILGDSLDDGYGTSGTFDATIAKNISIFFGSALNQAAASAYASNVSAIKLRTDRIPNLVAGAAGGLFIAGTNAATTVNITGSLSGSVGSVTGNVGGNVVGSVASLVGHTVQTGDAYAIVNNGTYGNSVIKTAINTLDDYVDTEVGLIKTKTDFLPSVAAGAAGGLVIAGTNAAMTVNITGNLTGNVTGSVGSVSGAVGSVVGHTPQTGDAYAVVNNGTYGNSALKTAINTLDDYVDSEVGAIKTKTDFLPSATAGTAGGLFLSGTNTATTVNFTGNLSGSVGSVAGHTPQTGDAYAVVNNGTYGNSALKTAIDSIDVDADVTAIKVKTDFLPSITAGAAGGLFIAGANAATTVNITGSLSGSVGSVSGSVGSVVGHTPQTGNSYPIVSNGTYGNSALKTAIDSIDVDADVTAIKAKTDFLPSATAGTAGGLFIAGANAATTVNITGNLSGSVGSVTGNVGGSVASVVGHTPQTGDAYAIVNSGTHGNSALKGLIDAVDNFIDTEVGAIKTKTDFLPSVAPGAAGGLLLAGANAATSFATLTSSGLMSINGSTNVAQSGDSFNRIGATGSGLTSVATGIASSILENSTIDGESLGWHVSRIAAALLGETSGNTGEDSDQTETVTGVGGDTAFTITTDAQQNRSNFTDGDAPIIVIA